MWLRGVEGEERESAESVGERGREKDSRKIPLNRLKLVVKLQDSRKNTFNLTFIERKFV